VNDYLHKTVLVELSMLELNLILVSLKLREFAGLPATDHPVLESIRSKIAKFRDDESYLQENE